MNEILINIILLLGSVNLVLLLIMLGIKIINELFFVIDDFKELFKI